MGHPAVDVVAPAEGDSPGTIWAYGGNGTGAGYDHSWQGTSLSCPVAAGVLALALEAYYDTAFGSHPAWDSPNIITTAEARQILKGSASDLGYDAFTQGTGQVNAEAACELAIEYGGGADSDYMMIGGDSIYINTLARLKAFFADTWSTIGLDYNAHMGEMYDGTAQEHNDTSLYYGIFTSSSAANESLEWIDAGAGPTSIDVYEYSAVQTVVQNVFFNASWFDETDMYDMFANGTSKDTYAADWVPGMNRTGIVNTTATTDDWYNSSATPFIGWDLATSNTSAETWRIHVDLNRVFSTSEWNGIFGGNGTVVMYISSDTYADYFHLFEWTDGDTDGLVHYPMAPTTAGELQLVSSTWAYGGGGSIWLNPASAGSDPILRIYDRASTGGSGATEDNNYTIELVRYDRVNAPWAQVYMGASSANIEVDPSLAKVGFTQGVAMVDLPGTAADLAVPLSFGKAYSVKHILDATVAPIDLPTDTTYDYEKWIGEVYDGNSRIIPLLIANASAGSLQVNITDVTGTTDVGAYNDFTMAVGDWSTTNDADTSGHGAALYLNMELIGGEDLYWVELRCYDAMYANNSGTARSNVEISVTFAIATPTFVPVADGYLFETDDDPPKTYTYPADGDIIGVASQADGDYCFNMTWENQATLEFPDAEIISSSLEIAPPAVDFSQAYSSPPDTLVTIGSVMIGTALTVTCTWEVGAASDMMDYTLYANDVAVADCVLGTAGGSPETCTIIVPATAVYSVGISNFAQVDNHGYIMAVGLLAGLKTTSTTNQVGINTVSFLPETWSLVATATNSFGGSYLVARSVYISNRMAPTVDITTALTGTLTGTKTVAIDVFDMNVNNSGTLDDQTIYLSIYLSTDISAKSRIPLALYIDVTTLAAADGTYTFSWDTTDSPNTYSGNLWVALTDGIATVWDDMGPFTISNTAGAAAGMSNSGNHSLTIPLVSLLVAVLGIGAIPFVLKALRKRRAPYGWRCRRF